MRTVYTKRAIHIQSVRTQIQKLNGNVSWTFSLRLPPVLIPPLHLLCPQIPPFCHQPKEEQTLLLTKDNRQIENNKTLRPKYLTQAYIKQACYINFKHKIKSYIPLYILYYKLYVTYDLFLKGRVKYIGIYGLEGLFLHVF